MASADMELVDSLMEVGRRLFSPPSDTEELLVLLDRTENYLLKVDQMPSPPIFAALCPVREALVAKDLLGHSNLEVKVAVASCVSEITRITAPDAPYDDDRMKVIFQMIVESFEKLDDISGRSFPKRVSILENVARVRSCVMMLDLECDALILDMFRFFLKTIRPNHPENVFFSMEFIMSLVLEESEDISPELISCLLNCVKKDNKEVLPVAHRLGENVISNSAAKLKPYLVQVQSLPGSYSKIVASICQENSDALEQNEINSSRENLVDDSKLSERIVSDELPQGQEVPSPKKVATADISPISVMNNGNILSGVGDITVEPTLSSQLPKVTCCNSESKSIVSLNRADSDVLESMGLKSDGTLDNKTEKVKERKPNSSLKVTDTEEYSQNDRDKETLPVPSKIVGHNKETGSSKLCSPCAMETESTKFLEPEEETDVQPLHSSDNGSPYRPSPTPSEGVPGTKKSKKGRPLGSKISSKRHGANTGAVQSASASQEKGTVLDDEMRDALLPSEETDMAAEPLKISEEKRPGKKMRSDTADSIDKLTSDLEAKSVVRSGKKGLRKKVTKDLSKKKSKSHVKQSKGGDVSLGKDVTRESNLKISGMVEDVDQQQKLDESILGSKIKVWWPDDERFYYGKVDSFDSRNEKHTIVYVDDEVEVLLLKEERFELLEDDVEIEEDQLGDVPSAFDSPEEVPSNKKAKANPGGSSKKGKKEAPLKRDEHVSGAASKPKGRPPKKSKDTPASQAYHVTLEITAPDSADEYGSGAVKSLAGIPKGRPPKKSKETSANTKLRTPGLDSSDKRESGVLKSSIGKPKGGPSKRLKKTPSSKSEYETPRTVSSKGKGSGRKSSSKSIGMDAPRTIVDAPKSSSMCKDGSVKSSSKSTVKTSKAIVGAPKSSTGKYKNGSVKSSDKLIGETAKSIVDGSKSSGKYKESSMKSHSKSMDLDSPKSFGKHKYATRKASIKPMDVDIPKSFGKRKYVTRKASIRPMDVDIPKSFGKHKYPTRKASKPMDVDIPKSSGKSKDGLMKTSEGTVQGGPKGDVTLQTVGDESTFDGFLERGKGKVRAGESRETKSHEMQTLAKVQSSLGSATVSRKRKARK